MKRLPAAILISLTFTACRGADSGLPADYRRLQMPETLLCSAEARERGRVLYQQHCVLCHGARADGQGVRREGLSSRPRDFTDSAWRRGASPRGLYFAIREGVRGTAMPSWKSLDEAEAWDLVAYLLSVGAAK